MQQLLANYLFQYKTCPVPALGTLRIESVSAASEIGSQIINPPINNISFSQDISDIKNLTEYIAANKNISVEEAAYQLKNNSQEITNLGENQEFLIAGVGMFSKNINGNLIFTPVETNAVYSLPVYAERVIHPDDSHAILVGDKETDRNTMTEFFTETEPVKKNKWWMWAAVIFIISIILTIIYFNNENRNSFFGVSHKYEMKETSNQYKSIP